MKKWLPDTNEFYIGYLPKGPKTIMSIMRTVISVLGIVVISIAFILAWQQRKFSSANFEYGIKTEVEGFLFEEPVPHVMVPLGNDVNGQQLYQTVLLVGSGKSGVETVVRQLLTNTHGSGTKARLNGSLIYGDGKALLQIDQKNDIQLIEGYSDFVPIVQTEENLSIAGEIVDPKCFFGVMKPGEGKAHRSCAIRCIAGGIPPVFSSDSRNYYLLVDENNKPISTAILNIVGDHITLNGKARRWNDWAILQIDSEMIYKLSEAKKSRENLLVFEEGMTRCN